MEQHILRYLMPALAVLFQNPLDPDLPNERSHICKLILQFYIKNLRPFIICNLVFVSILRGSKVKRGDTCRNCTTKTGKNTDIYHLKY
jgi:hypothetical protein